MSVCGQGVHAEDDSASEEVAAQFRDKTSDIYKQKPVSKVVRVLTVLAYLLSVSLAAILLSVYYVCVWKSPELALEPAELNALRGNQSDYGDLPLGDQPFDSNGGGDTAVNSSTTSLPENITSGYQNINDPDFTTSATEDQSILTDTTSLGYNGTNDNGSYNNTDYSGT